MGVGADGVRDLVRRLVSGPGRERGLAADSARDWLRSYDAATGAAVSRALELALLLESGDEAVEAQLNALAELAEWDLVPEDVIRRVCDSRAWTQPGHLAHVEYLRSRLTG